VNRRLFALSAASFLFGIALVHLYLGRLEREVAGGAPVELLVAARALSPGESLGVEDVVVRRVPEDYVDGRRVRASDLEAILGLPLDTTLAAGEGIVWSDVTGPTARGRQLSGLVAEGMRAVTITSKANLFEGLLRPGDRVDVLLTVAEDQGPETYTLLQNVLVLSVGGDLGGSDGERPRGSASVNLSVDLDDARALMRAERRGQLRLVLRNPRDTALLSPPPLPSSAPRPAPSPRPARKEIEHVR